MTAPRISGPVSRPPIPLPNWSSERPTYHEAGGASVAKGFTLGKSACQTTRFSSGLWHEEHHFAFSVTMADGVARAKNT